MSQVFDQRGNLTILTHTDDNHSNKTERFVIASEMECDALIQENRRLRENQEGRRANAPESFRLVARFPAPIVEQAMQEGWLHDDNEWARKVNDPDYRDFRVHGGRF